MYIPKLFSAEDKIVLHTQIHNNSFATLVLQTPDGVIANHLPLLLDTTQSENGVLLGHMARANPLWRHFKNSNEVLCIFQGPHDYVSPSWYETPSEHVPTWNYVAVHAYGSAQLIEDETRLLSILDQTIAKYEAAQPKPWVRQLAPDLQKELLAAIIGFEIKIDRLEGKFKLSQNRSRTDQERVVATLTAGNEKQKNLAEIMRDVLGI